MTVPECCSIDRFLKGLAAIGCIQRNMPLDNLFSAAAASRPKPLAEEARPSALDDIVGQEHILGEGKLLRRRIAAKRLGTVILYGPCGIGKTTIARAVGKAMGKAFVPLHPATSNVSDFKRVAEEARVRETLVFADEVHRFSASQADHLLGLTEEGVFDMIAATSMNPYHNLTPALVSRSTILELHPLTPKEISKVVQRAVWRLKEDGAIVSFEEGALEMLAGRSGGDARRALNTLEAIVVGREDGETVHVTKDMVDEVFQASPIPYDRKGAHYDCVSAFVKSMRGADEDATLYWLARLIHSGEDPRYIARRIMIHASEDVGLADNSALQTAVAAMHAVEKVGYPEARITLAHAALHVCRAPKSGSAYSGIARALEYVQSQPLIPVPPHLRDTHYEGAAPLGRGGYKSPHSTAEGWLPQEYAPGIKPGDFYRSDARDNPTFERKADEFWSEVKGRPSQSRFR